MSQLVCILLSLCLLPADGDLRKSDQNAIQAVRTNLKLAGEAYRNEEFKKAGDLLDRVKSSLDALDPNESVQAAAKPLKKSWQRAHKAVTAKLASAMDTDAAVSFVTDLAPQLSQRCIGCHGKDRARQELRLDSFNALIEGSENGEVVDTISPASSMLLLKMLGEADGDRMPPNGRRMDPEWIAKFEKWITQGAHFDGQDPTASLASVIQASRRTRLTGPELRKLAVTTAEKKWRLAFPQQAPQTQQTQNFLLVAPTALPHNLALLGEQAEETLSAINQQLGVAKNDKTPANLKAPLTIYVIPKRYDFAEWSEMVERRSTGIGPISWRSEGGLGYLVLGPDTVNNQSLVQNENTFSQILTSALLGHWGAPAWYADGRGLFSIAQRNRRAPRIKRWQSQIVKVLPQVKRAQDLFDAKLPVEQIEVASWAFSTFLGSDKKRAAQLHRSLQNGRVFDKAFAISYGKSPKDIGDAWLDTLRSKRRK